MGRASKEGQRSTPRTRRTIEAKPKRRLRAQASSSKDARPRVCPILVPQQASIGTNDDPSFPVDDANAAVLSNRRIALLIPSTGEGESAHRAEEKKHAQIRLEVQRIAQAWRRERALNQKARKKRKADRVKTKGVVHKLRRKWCNRRDHTFEEILSGCPLR